MQTTVTDSSEIKHIPLFVFVRQPIYMCYVFLTILVGTSITTFFPVGSSQINVGLLVCYDRDTLSLQSRQVVYNYLEQK